MLKRLTLLLLPALLLSAQTFDQPTLQVQPWTDDPSYYPPGFPGPAPCGPCRWGAEAVAVTTDLTTQAFVVTFQYRTADGVVHDQAVSIELHDTNGVRAGDGWVVLGTQPLTVLGVTRWMRVNQEWVKPDGR